MDPIDKLVNDAVKHGDYFTGASNGEAQVVPPVVVYRTTGKRPPMRKVRKWTEKDDAIMRDNYGKKTIAEIAAMLERSTSVVTNRSSYLGLAKTQRRPGYYNVPEAAGMLGVKNSKVGSWIEKEIIPGVVDMLGTRRFRRIRVETFERWVLSPKNWVHFSVRKIQDGRLKRLAEMRQKRWGDEWLSLAQAASVMNLKPIYLSKCLQDGLLPAAVKVNCYGNLNKSGRWLVLKSEAEATRKQVRPLRGPGPNNRPWSDGANAFIILAAAAGCRPASIAKKVGNNWSYSTIWKYIYRLTEDVQNAQRLINEYELGVQYDPSRKIAWVDWQLHRRRFPALERAALSFLVGEANHHHLFLVGGILAAWGAWLGLDEIRTALSGGVYSAKLSTIYRTHVKFHQQLKEAGVDPFGKISMHRPKHRSDDYGG